MASAMMYCWSRSNTDINTRSTFNRKAASWANDVIVLFEVPRTRASVTVAVAGREVVLCEGIEPSEIGGVIVLPEIAEKGNPSFVGSEDETTSA